MADTIKVLKWDPTLRRGRRAGSTDVITNVHGQNIVLAETAPAFTPLAIDANGKAVKADKTDDAKSEVKLYSLEAGQPDDTIQAAAPGSIIQGETGLTPKERYFLGAAGAKSTTAPTVDDENVVELGTAKSATEFIFSPQFLVKL